MTAGKHCPRCNSDKPLTDFHRNRSYKDGLSAYCKQCVSERSAQYYRSVRDEYTDELALNAIDVTANLAAIAAAYPGFIHVRAFDLPPQEEKLVITTAGIVQLGDLLAQCYLEHR